MAGIYIIAEAGNNHGGSMKQAASLIHAAADAKADAVKFQSFSADGLAHRKLAADQHEFFKKYELTKNEHSELARLTREAGLDFLSTPFDFNMVDLLAELDVPAFKIASCDLTNLPLIRYAASKGRPMYISSGMGNLEEARAAYNAAENAGSPRTVMLQCTTNYPAAFENVNLGAMAAMRDGIGCEVGFSDHSIGNFACFAAAALGATVIEKHICLDKAADGPDIACSSDPAEFADLVQGIRAIEKSLGGCTKNQLESEREIAQIARRGVYYAKDLPAGHSVCEIDLIFLRPASELNPADLHKVAGHLLNRSVAAGEAASLTDFDAAD